MIDLEAKSCAMRNWLCIAYAFPPINRSGTHRTAAFVRGLDALGWQASVLTVVPQSEGLDPALMDGVPTSAAIVRASWYKPISSMYSQFSSTIRFLSPNREAGKKSIQADNSPPSRRLPFLNRIAALVATPDSRTGWIFPATWKGLEIIRRRRPEIIFSTSPYASAHVIALILHKLTAIPWVADFRDPWKANPFSPARSGWVGRLDGWLESKVFEHAAKIVCATPTMADQIARRNPGFASKVSTILNGVDAVTQASPRPKRLARNDQFVLLHCGQFYGPRSPMVLFEGLRRFLAESPGHGTKILLALVGPTTYQGRRLMDLAATAGVADAVVVCGEKSHRAAIELSAGANALVLVGASGPGSELQVPQKLFEYLALKRPILGLLSADNPAVKILNESRFDGLICDADDAAGVWQAIKQLSDSAWRSRPDAWSGIHQFDRCRRVAELHEVFVSLTDGRNQVTQSDVPNDYATANSLAGDSRRSNRNTKAASSNIIAASAKRTKATQATLLPPTP